MASNHEKRTLVKNCAQWGNVGAGTKVLEITQYLGIPKFNVFDKLKSHCEMPHDIRNSTTMQTLEYNGQRRPGISRLAVLCRVLWMHRRISTIRYGLKEFRGRRLPENSSPTPRQCVIMNKKNRNMWNDLQIYTICMYLSQLRVASLVPGHSIAPSTVPVFGRNHELHGWTAHVMNWLTSEFMYTYPQ